MPLLAYTSDNGLGFGVRAELAQKKPGVLPHRAAYMLQLYASLQKYHYHLFRYDRVHPGGNERLRLTLNGVYRQWGKDRYFGIGNNTARIRSLAGEDEPSRYGLIQPLLHATLRLQLSGSLVCFLALQGKWSHSASDPGSLLTLEHPLGIDGGFDVLVASGILYDSRQPEADPQRGMFAEASGFGTLPLGLGPGKLLGAYLSWRGYLALFPWLVVASRVMTELMFGEVPFYEMVLWHGSLPIAGFGGFEGVRGLPFGRFRAPHRVVGSLELRLRLLERPVFGRPSALQLGLFGDGGMVWGGKSPAGDLPGSTLPVHLTYGMGLRLVYAESFVGRLDVGMGSDPVREPTGQITNERSLGIYLTFGQAF